MAKVIVVLKAILTRIIFGTHGFIAIWRVTMIKHDPYYWYLTASILALGFEGIFTLTIKKNQEWKWFCPSVFFYLCSVVPAIWLIEVDKFDKKLALQNRADEVAAGGINLTAVAKDEFPGLDTFGVELKIPVQLDAEMWVTVIEQFLMLILIIGRWMLPKGGLTRDQLSQLLLVYIGTAADIIEFFDSFKDDKISRHRILCLLILSIWSWSLLQFTFVLTATKARRTRLTTDVPPPPKLKIVNGIIKVKEVCCNIDVWAILINIILQDAPFLIFRALLILYYKIISYMNIFFTCKNTLVIILQFYRLYVVQQEKNKELSKMAKKTVSKNVANAVERAAARMGPQGAEGRVRLAKNQASGSKRPGKGPSSKQAQNKNKNRSQDSISSQNTTRSSSRRDRGAAGRRRSLSTGNLPGLGEGETFEDRIYEDDIELGMSGSALSGTNDPDSQEEDESEEVAIDDASIISERPTRSTRKNIRMSENPGIYKISGSRSSGSSERGHGRYRQDTGYSSSSKDSGHSGGRRGRSQRSNDGGRGGRPQSGRPPPNNRIRSSAQRRRQFISSKYCNSIEIGGYNGICLDDLGISVEGEESAFDNERLWQRRVAIGVVFFLFVVIFILCMVAIYGGINKEGLVLRTNIRTMKTTRRTTTTTTPEPLLTTANPSVSTIATYNNTKTTLYTATGMEIIPVASVSPSDITYDNETAEQTVTNYSLSSFNESIIEDENEIIAYINNNADFNNNGSDKTSNTDLIPLDDDNIVNTDSDTYTIEKSTIETNDLKEILTYSTTDLTVKDDKQEYYKPLEYAGHHNVRHGMSRILKFASDSYREENLVWKKKHSLNSW